MLSIAWKDLLILFRDRNALMYAFLLPIAFVVVFLGVSGLSSGAGGSGAEEDERVALVVANNDADGTAAQSLIADLDRHANLAVTLRAEADARASLDAREIDRVLIIPASFSADLAAGRQATLHLVNGSLDRGRNEAILMAVEGVARNMSLERQLVVSLTQLAQMQEADPSFDPTTSAALAIPLAKRQFEASQDRPLVSIERSQPASLGGAEQVEISGVQIGVPGFAVLFIFLTAQLTARSIYDEKKTGTFRRLLAAPLGKRRMLIGKLVPNFILVILQVIVLFAAGMFLLPLMGLDALRLGKDVPALVLLVLAVALCSTTLGILIAAVARTEAQIGGIAGLTLWVLAFLGGCFIPLFLINESMATLGQVTPHYWAVTGFYDLLTRGQGLSAILDSLLVLLGFSAVFFVIGTWRFEFE